MESTQEAIEANYVMVRVGNSSRKRQRLERGSSGAGKNRKNRLARHKPGKEPLVWRGSLLSLPKPSLNIPPNLPILHTLLHTFWCLSSWFQSWTLLILSRIHPQLAVSTTLLILMRYKPSSHGENTLVRDNIHFPLLLSNRNKTRICPQNSKNSPTLIILLGIFINLPFSISRVLFP